MKDLLKYAIILICFVSCYSQEAPKEAITETKFQIPSGAFPIIYRKHIYIEGIVDKAKGIFVFDTGADNFYFDSLFYNSNKFTYDKIAEAYLPGVGSKPQKTKLILDTVHFQFADYQYHTKMVPVFCLKGILGDFADGILGQNYFSGKALEINYQHKFMKIYDSISLVDIKGYSKIVYENVKNRLYVPLKLLINGSLEIEGKFTLDLGSPYSISLTSPTAKKFALNNKINNKIRYYTKYGGVGGESTRYNFKAESIFIGDYKLNNFVMEYSEDTNGALSSNKNFGLLGNNILEKFDIIIDFKNNCLYLKPNNQFENPFETTRLGFGYVDRGETYQSWIVTGTYEGSMAEKAGLMIDDKITHLNDLPIKEIDYEQQQAIFKKAETIKLTVNRNNKILIFNIRLKEIL